MVNLPEFKSYNSDGDHMLTGYFYCSFQIDLKTTQRLAGKALSFQVKKLP